MINDKVNIFQFATKELSQDAVLLYLADCFNDNSKQKIGKQFLSAFLGEDVINGLKCVVPIKQYKHMDVLLRLEYTDHCDLCVIEDKVYSDEHDNQLERYINELGNNTSDMPGNLNLPITNKNFIYFKPAIYNNKEINRIINIGYDVKTKDNLISVLEENSGDSICNSFREYFEVSYNAIDEAVKSIDKNLTNEQLSTLMSWRDGQWCLMEYLLNNAGIEVDYRKLFDGNGYGRNWTQYRFVFDNDIVAKNWDYSEEEFAKEPHSEFSYFFRLENRDNIPTLTLKQYKWSKEASEIDYENKNGIRRKITELLSNKGIVNTNKKRDKHYESEIARWQINDVKEINDIAQQLKSAYDVVVDFVTKEKA